MSKPISFINRSSKLNARKKKVKLILHKVGIITKYSGLYPKPVYDIIGPPASAFSSLFDFPGLQSSKKKQ